MDKIFIYIGAFVVIGLIVFLVLGRITFTNQTTGKKVKFGKKDD